MVDILIVEDEILISEKIKDCLIENGFGVTELVQSGEDALSLMTTKKPDAVIMDINLSGELDGISTAEKIYDQWGIPCIFLTSCSNRLFLDRAKRVGAFGYIVKPFDDFELIAMLEMTLYKAKMEAEKSRLEAQLQQAMKMEAIGTLAGGIAHDFNNILGVILGHSELIEEDLTRAGMDTESIKEVLVASRRARDLIRQILAFSRKNDDTPTPTDIKSLASNAFKFLRASIPTTVEIILDVEKTVGSVLIDPTQMLQVLMNLCTNAAQAMEKTGGSITISIVRLAPDTPELRNFLCEKPTSFIRLSVSDTGPGIKPDILKKIFDPYFTTKDVGKGSGLGLAVVHGIVKKNNGEIKVESVSGRGCAFHIYLPETGSKPKETQVMAPQGWSGGKGHILLVDDEETILNMLGRMLERQGYGTTQANSSSMALELFQANPGAFDCVMTDQTMPQITGIELAGQLLEIRPDIPIILSTGYSSTVDEQFAKQKGLKGFIMKPYDKKKLISTLKSVFSKE